MKNGLVLSNMLFLSSVLICFNCSSSELAPSGKAEMRDTANTVIMIGIDGLRASAIDDVDAPNLRHLAATGLRSAMIPVMPTKTFVNFYSLATGLYPEHHGMNANAPYDRQIGRKFNVQTDVQDPAWWFGEPIWITAEKQGVKSATYFWVGSEVAIDGIHPSFWKPYQKSKPYHERINEVLQWLDLPSDERPKFITLYFSAVDTAAHEFGVGSEQEKQAILRVDRHIGDLIQGLKARELMPSTNIIVVADHGMANVSAEKVIDLNQWVNLANWNIPEWPTNRTSVLSPYLYLFSDTEEASELYQTLKDVSPHMQVYLKGHYPSHYHFDHSLRGPDLMMVADPEWLLYANRVEDNKRSPKIGATHGYDNLATEMQATFIANGPDFNAGQVVASFENIEVYGLLACLLNINPSKTEGNITHVQHLLRKSCSSE